MGVLSTLDSRPLGELSGGGVCDDEEASLGDELGLAVDPKTRWSASLALALYAPRKYDSSLTELRVIPLLLGIR